MPTTTYPAWATPTDNVYSTTTNDQQDTEDAINALFAKHRHPSLNHVHPPLAADDQQQPLVNPWLQQPPTGADVPTTTTSTATTTTNAGAPPQPLPTLKRQAHLDFLIKQIDPLPASFVGFDTNRTWLLYWILHSYDLLSATFDARGRARAIATLLSFQNRTTGGFGGGPDQLAHLMSTFAAVLALATIGGPGPCPTADDLAQGTSVESGRGGWDAIDRRKMYAWMLSLKQPDGSFLVHEGGEVDVRASYCVVSVSLLLGICTPQLVRGLGDFIASCQTYEGGLAAGSQPSYTYGSLDGVPYLADPLAFRPQLGEAHGGYAYCALATHLALSRLPYCGDESTLPIPSAGDSSSSSSSRQGSQRTSSAGTLDVPRLVRWATSLQGTPVEGGGFRGRTNKLVDGCYGWFCGGGLFSVLDPVVKAYERDRSDAAAAGGGGAAGSVPSLNGLDSLPVSKSAAAAAPRHDVDDDDVESDTPNDDDAGEDDNEGAGSGSWRTVTPPPPSSLPSGDDEVDTSLETLYDRVALQEYILVAAQAPRGGLRDKPGKRPDAYHTNYNLAGLSLSQYVVQPSEVTRSSLLQIWKDDGPESAVDASKVVGAREAAWRKECYLSSLSYTIDAKHTILLGSNEEERENNRLQPTHPIFTITFPKAKAIMDWAYGQI